MIILKKHFVDGMTISDVCDKYQISPSMFYNWQKLLFEQGDTVFERSHQDSSASARKITALEQQIKDKDAVIVELTQAYLVSKKKNGDL